MVGRAWAASSSALESARLRAIAVPLLSYSPVSCRFRFHAAPPEDTAAMIANRAIITRSVFLKSLDTRYRFQGSQLVIGTKCVSRSVVK